ncbi:hypothetical protein EV360DRAFT_91148, partial [Lentinula raphanica]
PDPAPEPDPKPKKPRPRKKSKKDKVEVESEEEEYSGKPQPSNTLGAAATAAALTRVALKPGCSLSPEDKGSEEEEEDMEDDVVISLYESIPHNALQSQETYQLLHHDGTRSMEYDYFSHLLLPAAQLRYVMSVIHLQAKSDGRILNNGEPNPQWVWPGDYPIREVSVDDWEVCPPVDTLHYTGRHTGVSLYVAGRQTVSDTV